MKEGGAYADYGEKYGGVTESTCGEKWVRSAKPAQWPLLLRRSLNFHEGIVIRPRRGMLSHTLRAFTCVRLTASPSSREVTSVYTGRKSDEQEDFPRGGQGALSALEKRLIREKAKQEVLFSEVHPYCCGDCLSSAEE